MPGLSESWLVIRPSAPPSVGPSMLYGSSTRRRFWCSVLLHTMSKLGSLESAIRLTSSGRLVAPLLGNQGGRFADARIMLTRRHCSGIRNRIPSKIDGTSLRKDKVNSWSGDARENRGRWTSRGLAPLNRRLTRGRESRAGCPSPETKNLTS